MHIHNTSATTSIGLEALAHKGTNFPRRLRLSHIRRLARSLNNSTGELGGNHQMVEAVITKRDVASNCKLFDLILHIGIDNPKKIRFVCS